MATNEKDLERFAVLEQLGLLLLFGSITATSEDVEKALHRGLAGDILRELSKSRFRGSCGLAKGSILTESREQVVRRIVAEHETEVVKA